MPTPPQAQPATITLLDAAGQAHPRADASTRIVSLVPSLTELLFDLGLGERVVGRTGFCVHPREALRAVPKVGGTKDVNLARIRELARSLPLESIVLETDAPDIAPEWAQGGRN